MVVELSGRSRENNLNRLNNYSIVLLNSYKNNLTERGPFALTKDRFFAVITVKYKNTHKELLREMAR